MMAIGVVFKFWTLYVAAKHDYQLFTSSIPYLWRKKFDGMHILLISSIWFLHFCVVFFREIQLLGLLHSVIYADLYVECFLRIWINSSVSVLGWVHSDCSIDRSTKGRIGKANANSYLVFQFRTNVHEEGITLHFSPAQIRVK